MESSINHLIHSVAIGAILYLIMVYALKQRSAVAMDRSVLIGGVALIYMVLFGHGMPHKINKNIIGH